MKHPVYFHQKLVIGLDFCRW